MCIVAGLSGVGCARSGDSDANEITFGATDGTTIYATLLRPDQPSQRGLILLHMLGSDRSAWDAFAVRARGEGYYVLAFDMRGHGDTAAGEKVSYRSMDREFWLRAGRDIAAAKAVLIDEGAERSEIAIVGASIGANLALRYAALDADIPAVVLLSPGEAYRDVEILPALEQYGHRPILTLSAEGDSYATETARKLKSSAVDHCELRIYEGTAHGTDILAAYPAATGQILLWLSQILVREDIVSN